MKYADAAGIARIIRNLLVSLTIHLFSYRVELPLSLLVSVFWALSKPMLAIGIFSPLLCSLICP